MSCRDICGLLSLLLVSFVVSIAVYRSTIHIGRAEAMREILEQQHILQPKENDYGRR